MRHLESNRSGDIQKDINGTTFFMPKKLSENFPEINLDMELFKLNGEAERAIGNLNGLAKRLPNVNLFISPYIIKEALLSSEIEGTQSTIAEVMQLNEEKDEKKPAYEVFNYIQALNYGLEQLQNNRPLSQSLIHEIHSKLLKGVRGQNKRPGEYKAHQNMIGAAGCNISEAEFIPPAPNLMPELMSDWVNYFHLDNTLPPLIKAAILHYQFETIHPYSDENGRLGRLLITFMLYENQILDKPLLYISLFLKEYKSEYYKTLMDVRFNGDLEKWIKFFLRGVRQTSINASETANSLLSLRDKHRELINNKLSKYSLSTPFYDLLCRKPIISITEATKDLNTTYPLMKATFKNFLQLDILKQIGEAKRDKVYRYDEYLQILDLE